jgi:hypothetical protein
MMVKRPIHIQYSSIVFFMLSMYIMCIKDLHDHLKNIYLYCSLVSKFWLDETHSAMFTKSFYFPSSVWGSLQFNFIFFVDNDYCVLHFHIVFCLAKTWYPIVLIKSTESKALIKFKFKQRKHFKFCIYFNNTCSLQFKSHIILKNN